MGEVPRADHMPNTSNITEGETIKPFVVRPWWQAPDIAISETQEQALKDHHKVLAGAYGSSTTVPT